MTVFPHGNTPRTVVIPVGDPSPAACEEVAKALRETFEFPVPIRDSIGAPPRTDSNAHVGRGFLEYLRGETPDADLAVGVTDERIKMSRDQTALFGVAGEFDRVGVVSTARLLEGREPTALERERLAKEARSVVGTMLGLRTYLHTRREDRPCVVAPGETRRQLDSAPTTYCEDCRNALTDDATYPKPPAPGDWTVRTRAESDASGPEADGDRRTWVDYLLAPIGFAVIAVIEFVALSGPVVDRLPRPGTGSARDLPESAHEIYRAVTFWANAVLYLGSAFCWLFVTVSVHDRIFGPDLSDGVAIGLLLLSVALGVFTAWFVKGIVGGLRFVAAEEWS
ncbi:peptidase zinc-dependent [Natrinema salsiterrestre]|uniref:Peptidase zinc-dependent n=1 Tax=Natrinema salsiterrestre TaxID=2950540 RepID=A0A9Q4PZJ1_9EURY|nr:peptidase zinc-dependent [Natrinema salsiterrestre]MDF9744945.1 peptidase zinc-dependent [Natrinema salsiterrestre]